MRTGDDGHRHKQHLLFLVGTNLDLIITEKTGDAIASAGLAHKEERDRVHPVVSEVLPIWLRRARTVSGSSFLLLERSKTERGKSPRRWLAPARRGRDSKPGSSARKVPPERKRCLF